MHHHTHTSNFVSKRTDKEDLEEVAQNPKLIKKIIPKDKAPDAFRKNSLVNAWVEEQRKPVWSTTVLVDYERWSNRDTVYPNLERRTVASTSGGAPLPADCVATSTIAQRLAAVTFLTKLHTGIRESTSSAEVSANGLGHRGRSGSSTGKGAAGGTFSSAPDLRPSTRKGRFDGDEARGGRRWVA